MIKNVQAVRQILKQLNYILDRGQKRKVFWLLFVIILSAGFELIGVTIVLPFVECAVAPEQMMANKYVMKVVPMIGIRDGRELMVFMGIVLIFVYLLKNAFLLYSNYVQNDFSTRVQKDLAVKMLNSYMSRPYTFFLDTNSSEILRGCSGDITNVYSTIDYLCTIFTEILSVILIGCFMIYADPLIAISVLCLMLIVLVAIVIFFKPAIKKAGQKNLELSTEKSKTLLQAINGIKEIFVMQRKKLFLNEYERISDQARKVQRMYNILSNSPDRIVEGICISGVIGIVCIRLTINGTDMIEFIPRLAAFAMAAFKILPSVGKIANRVTGIVYCRPGLENTYRNIIEANRYAEIMKRYVNGRSGDVGQIENLQFCNHVTIDHVMWQYENQNIPVLKDIFLTIEKGQSIALIGASGSGKTTLSDVILGLLHPGSGTIRMDGIDVYTITEQWAHIVGYVPQAVYLIDDTVRNNVAFGIPEESIQDYYIWEALEKAQLREFVEKLPNGLNTIVGERGIKFSGGQRQRIAIARALYNNPEILVLDEATAALDNETESAVMESIDALQGKITMIIVAHRLTTIKNCDKIYEIRDGVAIERSKAEVFG